MKKFNKPTTQPVIEELRRRIRRQDFQRVADDLNICVSYLEKMAYERKPMTLYVAQQLGFRKVISWQPLVSTDQPNKKWRKA
jgi:hypothetical protein